MATMTGVMPAVRGDIRQSTTWSIVLSVLMMVTGVVAIFMSPIAGLAVTVMFGWLLTFTGALHLGLAWRGGGAATVAGEIVLAVLYAAIGVYVLARPVAGLASLTLAVAACLFAKGMLEGILAFKLRPIEGSGWLMVNGLLTVALAVMIASTWPASVGWTVGVLVGVAMFSSGLARLMLSVAVRRIVT